MSGIIGDICNKHDKDGSQTIFEALYMGMGFFDFFNSIVFGNDTIRIQDPRTGVVTFEAEQRRGVTTKVIQRDPKTGKTIVDWNLFRTSTPSG